MGVLIEAFSVVVRRSSIDERFRGGWDAFVSAVPNGTFCTDGQLARVSFMTPADVEVYVRSLEDGGLVFESDGGACDLAVVMQLHGPTIPAPWLEYGRVETPTMKVEICTLAGEPPGDIVAPGWWTYEGSLSENPGFVDDEAMDERVEFLRHEDGIDVFRDRATGKEVYMGRPAFAGDSEAAVGARLRLIVREALSIEQELSTSDEGADPARRATLSARLAEDLLPAVDEITGGPGSQLSSAWGARGIVLRLLDRRAEAETAFRRAHELDPRALNTLLELVRCLAEQRKFEEALPFARDAVDVAPASAAAWGNLAMTLVKTRDRVGARQAIDRAIELDPDDQINRYILENFDKFFATT